MAPAAMLGLFLLSISADTVELDFHKLFSFHFVNPTLQSEPYSTEKDEKDNNALILTP